MLQIGHVIFPANSTYGRQKQFHIAVRDVKIVINIFRKQLLNVTSSLTSYESLDAWNLKEQSTISTIIFSLCRWYAEKKFS